MADWPMLAGGFPFTGSAATSNTTAGPAIGAGATPHVKTAWVQYIAALAYDAQGLIVQTMNHSANHHASFDIAAAASGAEATNILIPDLIVVGDHRQQVYLPIAVPAGRRIAVRFQVSVASASHRLGILPVHGGERWPRGFQTATQYGFTAASTSGVATDSGATANT